MGNSLISALKITVDDYFKGIQVDDSNLNSIVTGLKSKLLIETKLKDVSDIETLFDAEINELFDEECYVGIHHINNERELEKNKKARCNETSREIFIREYNLTFDNQEFELTRKKLSEEYQILTDQVKNGEKRLFELSCFIVLYELLYFLLLNIKLSGSSRKKIGYDFLDKLYLESPVGDDEDSYFQNIDWDFGDAKRLDTIVVVEKRVLTKGYINFEPLLNIKYYLDSYLKYSR